MSSTTVSTAAAADSNADLLRQALEAMDVDYTGGPEADKASFRIAIGKRHEDEKVMIYASEHATDEIVEISYYDGEEMSDSIEYPLGELAKNLSFLSAIDNGQLDAFYSWYSGRSSSTASPSALRERPDHVTDEDERQAYHEAMQRGLSPLSHEDFTKRREDVFEKVRASEMPLQVAFEELEDAARRRGDDFLPAGNASDTVNAQQYRGQGIAFSNAAELASIAGSSYNDLEDKYEELLDALDEAGIEVEGHNRSAPETNGSETIGLSGDYEVITAEEPGEEPGEDSGPPSAADYIAAARGKIMGRRLRKAHRQALEENRLREAIKPVKRFAEELYSYDYERFGAIVVEDSPTSVDFNFTIVDMDSPSDQPMTVEARSAHFRMEWGTGNRDVFYGPESVIEDIARRVAEAEVAEEGEQSS